MKGVGGGGGICSRALFSLSTYAFKSCDRSQDFHLSYNIYFQDYPPHIQFVRHKITLILDITTLRKVIHNFNRMHGQLKTDEKYYREE